MAVLLLLSAIVQLNDPDPLRWFLYYTACACVLFGIGINRLPTNLGRCVSWVLIAIAGLWFCLILQESWAEIGRLEPDALLQRMSNDHPGNELLKELGGLVVASLLLFFSVIRNSASTRGTCHDPDKTKLTKSEQINQL